MRIPNQFIKTLQQKNMTVALAESVTCGLAASKLATVKGTSDVLKGAITCYVPEVKMKVLNVPKTTIEKYTCESTQTTEQLVKGLSKIIEADIYAAVTGLAAPGGSESKQKPVGTIFISVLLKGKIYNHHCLFRGSPLEIRTKACLALYKFVLDLLKEK